MDRRGGVKLHCSKFRCARVLTGSYSFRCLHEHGFDTNIKCGSWFINHIITYAHMYSYLHAVLMPTVYPNYAHRSCVATCSQPRGAKVMNMLIGVLCEASTILIQTHGHGFGRRRGLRHTHTHTSLRYNSERSCPDMSFHAHEIAVVRDRMLFTMRNYSCLTSHHVSPQLITIYRIT